ncbi:S1C family serine protease [Natronobacterium gregoryi]|uniref:Peptidase S1 and S6 chymotrypsin/Hap n=2 Tax=Natronobacterium gregoryi TaxID=44930 RepID=L0AFP9_NATGS|nr:trypsin-like peptidase domain-containing protein [Natronobacterium gregoryi]AFZ72254.1 trypsin-like serine protease with C-terminal PDZ domain [Natronobacterium gregoryi SP2]ELY62346.1 peptidase S1 and S6 chymotrypsin/Hap [Natronobacterium gregoryi SP2]PLK20201.1 serine protease [Natronobacterium gregoryi SP2]SFJ29000.1 serine protease, S1-C subfamily, contains C-terminal PDZ domain [Natronobacterium gregoryi]
MNDARLDRRRVLAAVGAGLASAVAGCTEPRSGDPIEGGPTGEIDRDAVADGSAFTDVYEAIIDSVTMIRVLGVDDPLTGGEGRGQGSGFLVDDTHVVTNDHVVAGGEEADLQYVNGDWTNTRLVGSDRYSDLAVLEVDHVPDEATPLSLAEERPVVGQQVVAVGNPYGLEGTLTEGVVSGVNRTVNPPDREFSYPNVIQTDAAVNPGNSGGPLVDLGGNVVGVVNAAGGDNIGFAISAALTRRVVPALIEDGEYHHSYMGIGLASVDRIIAQENDLERATGVIATDIVPDEAADGVLQGSNRTVRRSGELIPVGGDVILEMDGQPIPDRHALSAFLALETSPGQTIDLRLWRNGSEIHEQLTLGAR